MTTKQYRQVCANLGVNPLDAISSTKAPNKFGARKKSVDGHLFDSTAEARRYVELKAMQSAGLISNLVLQPSYVLQDRFRDAAGKAHSQIRYIPDFRYTENGRTIVEDLKGYRTDVYRMKAKLFMARYPDIDFREVK